MRRSGWGFLTGLPVGPFVQLAEAIGYARATAFVAAELALPGSGAFVGAPRHCPNLPGPGAKPASNQSNTSAGLFARGKFRKPVIEQAVSEAPVNDKGQMTCPTCNEVIS